MIWKNKYLLFSIIVLINIISKAIFAGNASFSFDEIISVKNTLLDFGHIKHEAEWDNNPPFYYYCLWVWHQFLPIDEFNSRLMSVIFVSFAIGFTYLFAEKHFCQNTALFNVLLLSFSNFLFFYSVETRAYSLVFLLSILSTIQFFKYLKNPSFQKLAWLSFVNFLLIYTHYISGLIIILQYVFIFIYHRELIRSYYFFQTVIIFSLILLRFTKKQFLNIFNFNSNEDFWLKTASYSDLTETFKRLYYNKVVAVIILITLFWFFIQQLRRRKDQNVQVEIYCFGVGFLTILILYFIGIFKAIFLDRYLIFAIPFATIIVCNQFNNIKIYGKLLFVITFVSVLFSFQIKKEPTMDYKNLVAMIKPLKSDLDYILINTKDNLGLFEYYYDKQNFIKYNKNLDSICRSMNIYGLNDLKELKKIEFKKGSRIFLIQSFHKLKRNDDPIQNMLSTKTNKVYSSNQFNGVELTIFKHK